MERVQSMEQVQSTEEHVTEKEPGLMSISKEELGNACQRIRSRMGIYKSWAHRGQLLHRYRMGLALSSGALGGLIAGHVASGGLTAAFVFVAGGAFATFFGAISKLDALDSEG